MVDLAQLWNIQANQKKNSHKNVDIIMCIRKKKMNVPRGNFMIIIIIMKSPGRRRQLLLHYDFREHPLQCLVIADQVPAKRCTFCDQNLYERKRKNRSCSKSFFYHEVLDMIQS